MHITLTKNQRYYIVFSNIRWSLSIVYSALFDMNYNININNNAYYYNHYHNNTNQYFSLLSLSSKAMILIIILIMLYNQIFIFDKNN